MEKIPTIYNSYNFILKQLDSSKKGFSISYKDKEIATYDSIVPLNKIDKKQLKYNLDIFFPMNFLRFSNDFFNFRMGISIKFYKYKLEEKQEFFFNYSVFDEYCSQIIQLIDLEINELDKKLNKTDDYVEKFNEGFSKTHQKVNTLIERLYNHQRNYSSNPILNNKIHVVVSKYPDFGLSYDLLIDKLKLFSESEKDNYLIIDTDKTTKEDWAQYFGNMKTFAEWGPIEAMFNMKQMKQSCNNINNRDPEKKAIESKLNEYFTNLP
jgi:hypothetical protein